MLCVQSFYLNSHHLEQLKKETGVQPWHFEQHPGEGVFIPAGCPHQVTSQPHSLPVTSFVCSALVIP